MNRLLTSSEINRLTAALQVAAEVYEKDATTCPELALTFRTQAIEARKLQTSIEMSDDVKLLGCDEVAQ